MTLSLESFVDELEKISAEVGLTPGEKRRQAAQFAGLGVTTLPALASIQERVRTGRWLPKSGRGRFLAAAGLGGLFWGGALPHLQHGIARTNIAKARARMAAEKEMKALVPGGVRGVQRAVKQLPIEAPGPAPGLPPEAPNV
jgi:hypothetical protein